MLAIAEPNSSQQFVVGLEFTGSGKKRICQPFIYIFLLSYSVLVDYSSCISPGHVDPLSVESVSAEMGVHSPIFFLTVYSTAICILLHTCLVQRYFKLLFKHLARNGSNCFSRQTKSLVPPTKPVLRLPQGGSSCVSVQGSGWPSPPEHFCCGSLQTPSILVFIASGQAHTLGSHNTAW